LISPAIGLVESATSLLLKTDGDLAGWLGDLAPRGDLDSTPLLYRIFGLDMASLRGACKGHTVHDRASHSALACLTSQGLPVLSLAFRMLSPAHGASLRGQFRNSIMFYTFLFWSVPVLMCSTVPSLF
jgi:hypothetical protein